MPVKETCLDQIVLGPLGVDAPFCRPLRYYTQQVERRAARNKSSDSHVRAAKLWYTCHVRRVNYRIDLNEKDYSPSRGFAQEVHCASGHSLS